ncbi:MAG: sulfatase-like hydrolase/transferase [Elusimicrobiaceae bacterium]|nr:sulfatase-like hydrolase/transferase [Elusimicrobiaceae bacterium]
MTTDNARAKLFSKGTILFNFAVLCAVYLFYFGLTRLVFLFVFGNSGLAAREVLYAFFQGGRLDLSLAATFALPVYVLLALLSAFNAPGKAVRACADLWFGLFNAVLLGLWIVEFPFYSNYSSRLNHLFFEYFANPKELAVTMSGIVNLWVVLPLILLAMGAAVYATLRLDGKIFAFRAQGAGAKAASLALAAGLTVLFIRGGFQRRPINWGAAFFSSHNIINQLALNGPYNLFQCWQIYEEEKGRTVSSARYYADGEALEILRSGSDWNAPPARLLPGSSGRPNVVLVTMESFAGKYCGAVGAKQSLTPNFDRLAGTGLLFTNFYGNATRTSRALLSALNSYPPLPGVNLTKKIQAQQAMPSVAQYLLKEGYATLFFYGGDRHFEDMSGFFLKAGFEKFYDFSDFTDVAAHNPIGVYDEDLFFNVNRILSGAKTPFFAEVMTLTNHGPFTLPPAYTARPDLPKELRTMYYSDYALGKFIEQARSEPYFNNTVFIITADHATYEERFVRDRFHIPLLVWSPLLQKPGREERVFSQLNLPMSVLGLCGASTTSAGTPFFGTPFFAGNGMAYVLEDPYFGVITDRYFYRETISGGQGYLFYLNGAPATDPGEQARLARYARAMLQISRELFFKGQAAGSWKKPDYIIR